MGGRADVTCGWRYRGIDCRLTLPLVHRGRPFVPDAGGPLVARAMVKCLHLIGQRVSVKPVIQSCFLVFA